MMHTSLKNSLQLFVQKGFHVYFYVGIFLLISTFFARENVGRYLIVLISFVMWIFLSQKEANWRMLTLLFVTFLFPFNITIGFPSLSDPYVNGSFSNYLVPTLHLLDVFIILFLLVQLRDWTFVTEFVKKNKWIIGIFLLYFLIHIISHFNLLSIINLSRIYLYIFTFALGVKTVKDIVKGRYFPIVLLLTVIMQGVLGIIQFSKGFDMNLGFLGESELLSGVIGSSFISLSQGVFLRAYGTFPHPNVLAGFFLFALFVLLYLLLVSKKERRLIPLSIAVISSIFIIFTFARLSIFLTVLIWLVFFMYKAWELRKANFSILPLFFERSLNLFTSADTSIQDRVSLLKASFDMIKRDPLGIGSSQFVANLKDYSLYTSSGITLLQPVHNIFTLVLVEHGFIGGLGLIVLLGALFFGKLFSTKGIYRFVTIGAGILFVSIGMFDHYLITLPQGLVFTSLFVSLLQKD